MQVLACRGKCLYSLLNGLRRVAHQKEGKAMKYTVKHHKLNNQWYVVTKNPALTYSTVVWFDTKSDAEQYVKDQIEYSKELMKNVPSIHDYFKVGE